MKPVWTKRNHSYNNSFLILMTYHEWPNINYWCEICISKVYDGFLKKEKLILATLIQRMKNEKEFFYWIFFPNTS